MSFLKRFIVIAVTVTLGISLLGAIPVLADAPSITGVVIAPDPAYTDSNLEATPQGWYDADDDTEGYQWQWQKYNTDTSTWEDISEATSNALDSSNFVKDDQIKVICTPFDSTETGTPVEATITISNSPPSVESVSISPSPAFTDSTLVATPSGWFDADGDVEGYQWQWQKYDETSTSWQDVSGATSNTLDSSNFGNGDQIKVICTPDDGTDTGNPVEATITIYSLQVIIDIKPGSLPNSINIGSQGVIPVAILTTEDFDASLVDGETVRFGPGEAEAVHYAIDDVDGDGDADMILHFRTQEVGLGIEDIEATLFGETEDGSYFIGTDEVTIVPSNDKVAPEGKDTAPGQNKEPGESATGKAIGKETAPGQNKEPGESAEGKAKGKDK